MRRSRKGYTLYLLERRRHREAVGNIVSEISTKWFVSAILIEIRMRFKVPSLSEGQGSSHQIQVPTELYAGIDLLLDHCGCWFVVFLSLLSRFNLVG